MSEPPVHTGVDEVHPHAHRTGHRWVDTVIAVSAITISVISLFVAIEHGRIEGKLVAANSWPFLVFKSSENGLVVGSRVLDLRLENSGVGPARVESVEIDLDGRPLRDHTDLMSRCCGAPDPDLLHQVREGLISQNELIGVLPAREGVDFLAWRELPGNDKLWSALNTARNRLTFHVCYCSVLDECWNTDLTPVAHPRPVRECKTSSNDYAG